MSNERTNKEWIDDNNLKIDEIKAIAQNLPDVSGGDIKLFETVENMQQDPTAQEGDLAVVYREEIQPVTEESEFDSCIFPNEVVLDEAFSASIYGSFRSTGSDYFDGMVDMSSSRFRFNGWGDSAEINVEYGSQDGITYTRTDGGEELQEFGTPIKWESRGDLFNSVIGNFMKIGGNYFDGMYEYKNHISKKLVNVVTSITTESSIPVLTQETYDISIMLKAKKLLINNYNFVSGLVVQRSNDIVDIYCVLSSDAYYFLLPIAINGVNNDKYLVIWNTSQEGNVYKFSINTTNNTVVREPISMVGSKTYTINSSRPININYSNEIVDDPFILLNNDNIVTSGYDVRFIDNNDVGHATNLEFSYQSITDYTYASTQLNATEDYVYGKTFYGKNGVEDGTLLTDISNKFTDTNAELYSKVQVYYDTLTPRILTAQDKKIDINIEIVPCRSDGTPLLDTSALTSTNLLFGSCSKLKTIASIDTSNVTNMQAMFNSCSSLITIPLLDTSNVTNMNNMFSYCKALINIPQLDTSNVTDMGGMFADCVSLTTIPQLNTSKVTSMSVMFVSCGALEVVPVLDTSNVTNMQGMFRYCTSLSNQGLDNILQMCINATNVTTKTLKYLELTQEQANICTTLSNYSAFTAAGWTTGY